MSIKDDQIVAAVIAASESLPFTVRKGSFINTYYNVVKCTYEGACCAVGAGALYAGFPAEDLGADNATRVFARSYNVSETYAIGVSDGFEDRVGRTDGRYGNARLMARPDYRRGWNVGQTIAVAIEEVRR